MRDMSVLLAAACFAGLVLKLVSVYFGSIACFAFSKEQKYPPAKRSRKMAVLAACRNEEAVIGGLVKSLKVQDYPAEYYDIYVIPNNCTDHTEEAARQAGAKIIQCTGVVGCKGDALHQAVEQLMKEDYEVFCVFDADNHAAPDFLTRMNEAFDAGARVVKARQVAKNPHDSWVSGCYGIYFDMFHMFFNHPRAVCGLSAKLVGTGFAVHRDVLERLGGWNTSTIAEDAEFSSQCAELGERIWWAGDAVTYDEQPLSFRVSLTQRRRWCSGVMQVAKLRLPVLLEKFWKGQEGDSAMLLLDFIMFLIAPFTQAVSIVPLGLVLLCKGLENGWGNALQYAACGILLYMLVMMLLAAGLVWFRKGEKTDWQMGKAVLLFPLFMASWVPLQIASLCRETKKWEEIRHTGRGACHKEGLGRLSQTPQTL